MQNSIVRSSISSLNWFVRTGDRGEPICAHFVFLYRYSSCMKYVFFQQCLIIYITFPRGLYFFFIASNVSSIGSLLSYSPGWISYPALTRWSGFRFLRMNSLLWHAVEFVWPIIETVVLVSWWSVSVKLRLCVLLACLRTLETQKFSLWISLHYFFAHLIF